MPNNAAIHHMAVRISVAMKAEHHKRFLSHNAPRYRKTNFRVFAIDTILFGVTLPSGGIL